MNPALAIVLMVVLSAVSAYIANRLAFERGRKSVVIPEPEPKLEFGFDEAMKVMDALGGKITPTQAEAARMACMVTMVPYTVCQEVKEHRKELADDKRDIADSIERYKAAIRRAEGTIEEIDKKDTLAAGLEIAFGAAA